jgi:hypothetical protein
MRVFEWQTSMARGTRSLKARPQRKVGHDQRKEVNHMPMEAAQQRELLVSLTSTVPSLAEAAGHVTDALPDIEDDSVPADLLASAVALGEAAAPTAEAVPLAAQLGR